MDLEKSRSKVVKGREITYSAEYGAEIRATITYQTLAGEFLAKVKYYNRAECLRDYAEIIKNKKLLARVENSKEYLTWLENY